MNRKKSTVKMSVDGNWHTAGLVEITMGLISSNSKCFMKNVSSEMKGGVLESHEIFSCICVFTV